MDIDRIEDKLGGLSSYQVFVIFSCALMSISASIVPHTGYLYNAVPNHRCSLPTFDNQTLYGNFTSENITTLAIPPGNSCHRYDYNATECLEAGDLSCLTNASEKGEIDCDNGYYYDNTFFEETVISEWDLICSKQIWIAILNSLYFLGILIGSPPIGYMVDWYGRKFSLIVLAFGITGSGIGCAFAPNLPVYCVFRFLEGVATVPACGAVFSYGNEMSSRKLRAAVGTFLASVTAVSHTLLPVIAFYLRDWRDLNLCLALMPIAFLLTCPFIPETPRWLLVKGRTAQAKTVLDRIAKSKGKILDDDDWTLMIETEKKKMELGSSKTYLSDLFTGPFIRIVTLIVMFNWFAINCVFYGLVLNVGTLTGDPYVNAILNGATEIAATFLYMLILAKKGPRMGLIIGTGMSGMFCLVALVAGQYRDDTNPAVSEIVRWTSIIGKFFASVAFYSTYQYTNDVFPTVTRGKAMALASTSARIGSMIIPFILFAQFKEQWVVESIFGILGLSSALFTLILPNTTSRVLTTTIQEAEDYYSANMPWAAKCLGKNQDLDENDGKDNDIYNLENPEIKSDVV